MTKRPAWTGLSSCVVLWLGVSLAGCGRPSGEASSAKGGKTAAANSAQQAATDAPQGEPPASNAGANLYAQHCAACHGEKGDGRGVAAQFLYPKPRDFRAGRFRLVSTVNGVPSLEDLQAVIERGMPGSAMIPWAHLAKADRELLAGEVLRLRRAGARDIEVALAAEADEERTAEELDELAGQAVEAGEVFAVPTLPPETPEAIARGKQLYSEKGCASCHGPSGKGDGQQNMVDAEGRATRPRDLTVGIFKGNADSASVYRRIALGMPGSPMPASQNLSPEQVSELVYFVLSLSDEAARERAVLRRQRVVARRVAALPADADDPQWSALPAVRLPTAPLWWRDEADPALQLRALHDGASLAIRLEWDDESADQTATRSEAFKDAAAIELFRGSAEPFVGMGSRELPVEVWMWDADRQRGPRDVELANPNLVVDQYPFSEGAVTSAEFSRPGTDTASQPDVSLPARAVGNSIVPSAALSPATTLDAGGPGTLTFRPPISQSVKGHGRWRDGRWTVVMHRPLKVSHKDELTLAAGDRVSLACAIWNGSCRDRDGQKRITIWNDLELQGGNVP